MLHLTTTTHLLAQLQGAAATRGASCCRHQRRRHLCLTLGSSRCTGAPAPAAPTVATRAQADLHPAPQASCLVLPLLSHQYKSHFSERPAYVGPHKHP